MNAFIQQQLNVFSIFIWRIKCPAVLFFFFGLVGCKSAQYQMKLLSIRTRQFQVHELLILLILLILFQMEFVSHSVSHGVSSIYIYLYITGKRMFLVSSQKKKQLASFSFNRKHQSVQGRKTGLLGQICDDDHQNNQTEEYVCVQEMS